MATSFRQQDVAVARVSHLHPDKITCRICGEQSASSNGWVGFAHRWGPTTHAFFAKKPDVQVTSVSARVEISINLNRESQ